MRAYLSLGLIVLLWQSASADDFAPVTAGVPTVVNAASTDTIASDTSTLTVEQRLTRLEHQVNAMNQLNLLSQTNDLQQQVQTLQGQVELLTHNLQKLQNQLVVQYANTQQATRDNTPSPEVTSASDTTTTVTMSEQIAYQQAYTLVKNKHYQAAITALQNFLNQYPKGKNAANAYYWLGQLSLLQGNGKTAAKYFNTLMIQFPTSNKIQDANLKLGFAYILDNQLSRAKEQFKQIIQQYPGTTTAKLAQTRLTQLQ